VNQPQPLGQTRFPSRWFDNGIDICNAAGTLLIVALGLLVNVDVFGRAIFNAPIAGVPELAGLTIVAIVFLQIPYCLRHLHLTRSDAFLNKLLKRRPQLALALDSAYHLLGSATFAIIAYAAWNITVKAWTGNEYQGAQGVFMIPVWPVKAVVVLGSFAMMVQFLRVAFSNIGAICRGEVFVTTFAAGEEL
jgi:TRAP-type mannitol/chloroaromatic compound transport system permease small subunit